MRVSHLVQVSGGEGWIVGLLDDEGQRVLPLRVGTREGLSIALAAQGAALERPLTHDLLVEVIRRLGASVARVAVHDMQGHVFIGQLDLVTPAGVLEVDCRPSDAIAVALRVECPIVVDENVLLQAAVTVSDDDDEDDDEDDG